MPPLSDRHLDAFENPAKAACREGNLRVLREAAYLLWEDGGRTRLRCDWCELMGATGLLTLDLLERGGPWRPAASSASTSTRPGSTASDSCDLI